MEELLRSAQQALGLNTDDLAAIYAAALRRAYGEAMPERVRTLCGSGDVVALEAHVEFVCRRTPVVGAVVLLAQRGVARREKPLAAL